MEKQKVLDRIKSSMMVLVGIGTEISEKHHTREELLAFYQEIAGAVKGKFYFVVTLNTDDLIYEAGFDPSLKWLPAEATGQAMSSPTAITTRAAISPSGRHTRPGWGIR